MYASSDPFRVLVWDSSCEELQARSRVAASTIAFFFFFSFFFESISSPTLRAEPFYELRCGYLLHWAAGQGRLLIAANSICC